MNVALVDCNNFYASCETLFQPRLAGRPVVVLSNNDGCVVARSAEAKSLGIKMGEPWHLMQDVVRRHGIVAFSSNYALYGDMSARVMRLLSTYSPRQEVYSIDECFLDLDGLRDPVATARDIRREVRRQIGLQVCVGIGGTKTLAKLANHLAKKRPQYDGVCSLSPPLPESEVDSLLSTIDVGEVWGVGYRLTGRLQAMGIRTALDLRRTSPATIRRHFNVTLARTVEELNGETCHELTTTLRDRQQICASRSFGRLVDNLDDLEEAVAAYATRAAEKLRQQGLVTTNVGVMLRTNPFRTDLPQYQKFTGKTVAATADTRVIAGEAITALRSIFCAGYAYQKAGVLLSGLVPADTVQLGLFDDAKKNEKSRSLMEAIDRVNRVMGRGTVRLLAEGDGAGWAMRSERRSPRYTTRLDEIPVARA